MEPAAIKIRFNDGSEMLMSKSILARNSDYFLALFRSGMKENRNNCVELHYMGATSAKAVMNFLKYDKLQLHTNNVICILEASVYFEIPSLQEKCFKYLSTKAIHYLNDIIELSQLFNKNRLEALAFAGAAQNFQMAINCRYRFSLDRLRTLFASTYMTVSSEYDLARYIVHFIHNEVKDSCRRETLSLELMRYVSLSSMPIHCLLCLYYWTPVKKGIVIKMMIKETYLYHMKTMIHLPLKRYLLPRRTKWNILACSEHIIEQVTLIWPNNEKSKPPDLRLKKFDGKGKIRELVWAFGFLYVFLMNDFLRFDPVWNRWVRLTLENVPLQTFTVVAFKDFIYKIGGQVGFNISSRVERYSPRKNSWSDVCPLNSPTCALSVVVYEGKLVVSGGLTDKMVFSREVFTLDLAENKWQSLAPLNFGRYGHQSVVFDGKLYVFGGTLFEVGLDEMSEVFTSVTNQWTILHFDISFHFRYIWTVDEDLFAIEGVQTSRRTKLARIDLQTNRIIKYEDPLPFSLKAYVKYVINRDS